MIWTRAGRVGGELPDIGGSEVSGDNLVPDR